MADAADDSSFLAILLESSPLFWSQLTSLTELTPQSYVEQLLVFVNAYLMLNDANRLVVFAAGTCGSYLLYQTPNCLPGGGAGPGLPAGMLAAPTPLGGDDGASDPAQQLLQRLRACMELEDQQRSAAADAGSGAANFTETALSSALSRVLCFVNSVQRAAAAAAGGAPQLAEGPGPSEASAAGAGSSRQAGGPCPRVLCLLGSPDVPTQYIAVMNAIFSAQRSEVILDGLKLGGGHSSFLQQAAYLTGGSYLAPSKPAALAQYLLSVYAADPFSRQFLRLPKPAAVDFRASCFCHKRPIDLGYVCSVCLSIFCADVPACTTCGTEFSSAAAAKTKT